MSKTQQKIMKKIPYYRVPDSTNDPSINMSCLGTNSPPVYPWVILNDYDGMYEKTILSNLY
jgi:hypothetical protein